MVFDEEWWAYNGECWILIEIVGVFIKNFGVMMKKVCV